MNKFLLATLVIGSTISTAQALDSTTKTRVFSTTSFWYKPIPTYAGLHSNSYNYVQEFLRQKKTYWGTVNINTTSYTSPVYFATSSSPKVNVKQWDCQKKGYTDATLKTYWTSVPIPSNAVQAKGTDAEMTVYDPATDSLYEFWRARKNYGAWEACWGGRIKGAKYNGGTFSTYYGTTATSLPFIGGQITAEELAAGQINHVMGISLPDVEKRTIFSWPAQRSDGVNPYNVRNRIPEGMRFRLDPTVNVAALPMSAAGKTIARAAQKYGFVVWDRAGAISLRAQNSLSYTQLGKANPYPALFSYKQSYDVLTGFPWNRLQFMPMNYRAP